MNYKPAIGKCNQKFVCELTTGNHTVYLLDDIESLENIQYLYALVVFDDALREACLFITAEVDSMAKEMGIELFHLGLFRGDRHENLGASADWADIDKFEQEALRLANNILNIE